MTEIGHTFGFGEKVTWENTSERNVPLHDSNNGGEHYRVKRIIN